MMQRIAPVLRDDLANALLHWRRLARHGVPHPQFFALRRHASS